MNYCRSIYCNYELLVNAFRGRPIDFKEAEAYEINFDGQNKFNVFDKNESKIVRKLEKFKTIKKNVENLNLPQIKKKDSQPKIKNYEGLNNKLMKRPEEVEITLHNEKKTIHTHHNISIESVILFIT